MRAIAISARVAAMSLSECRFAADSAAYYTWDGVGWAAAATEHSHSRTSQSSNVRPAQRIAADGMAYTYTDFVTWYGTHAARLWEEATATEHSGSTDLQPLPSGS